MGMDAAEVRACYERYCDLLNSLMDPDSFGLTFEEFLFVFGMSSMDELHMQAHTSMPRKMANPHFLRKAEEVEEESEFGPEALFNRLKNESNHVDVKAPSPATRWRATLT